MQPVLAHDPGIDLDDPASDDNRLARQLILLGEHFGDRPAGPGLQDRVRVRERPAEGVGEFLGGGKGFGELIRVAASQLQTARVFALILYLSLLGLVLFWTVVLVQRRLVFWQRGSVRGAMAA